MFTYISKILGVFLLGGISIFLMAKMFNVPHLNISQEAFDDGEFQLSEEYMFVKDAYRSDGSKMTKQELKDFASQESTPRFSMDVVSNEIPHGK